MDFKPYFISFCLYGICLLLWTKAYNLNLYVVMDKRIIWATARLIWVFAGRTGHFVCLVVQRLISNCESQWYIFIPVQSNRQPTPNESAIRTLTFTENKTFCLSEITHLKWMYGPRQANLVLIAYASSEGSGEPAHPRSIARTFAARSYKQWAKRNLQTESQIPGPSEWLGMRS